MESIKRFINVPNVVLGLAVAFVIALGWPWDQVAAAWVQAVGSVAAILVAVWMSHRRESNLDSERTKRECVYMFKAHSLSAYATGSMVITTVLRIDGHLVDRPRLELTIQYCKEIYGDICEFSYLSFADLEFANAWQEHKRWWRALIQAMEAEINGETFETRLKPDQINKCIEAALEKMTVAIKKHEKVIESEILSRL